MAVLLLHPGTVLPQTLLLNNNGYDNDGWQAEPERQWSGVKLHRHGDVFDPAEITYALVWNHPVGDLQRYPNLKAIFSLGAGAEHLIADPALPDVPVVLLADPAVARDMAAHALYWVLGLGRIGMEVATRIRSFDYVVSGWDASDRRIDRIDTVSGANRLGRFLGSQELVINCLPLTDGTIFPVSLTDNHHW